MAIFVANQYRDLTNPAENNPQSGQSIGALIREIRRENEAKALRERELSINEKRYQDYLKFRNEELAARKAVEDRIAGQEDTAYQRQLDEETRRGQQEHNAAVNILNIINAQKRDLITKRDTSAAKIQELQALQKQGKPVDANTLKEWVKIFDKSVAGIDRLDAGAMDLVAQLRTAGHGQLLYRNENGEYALSAPILPRSQPAVESSAGSFKAGPISEATETLGTPANIPGEVERPGAGTGEGYTTPRAVRPYKPLGSQNVALIPTLGRALAMGTGDVLGGAGGYLSNLAGAAKGVYTPAYRWLFSQQAGQPLMTDEELRKTEGYLRNVIPETSYRPDVYGPLSPSWNPYGLPASGAGAQPGLAAPLSSVVRPAAKLGFGEDNTVPNYDYNEYLRNMRALRGYTEPPRQGPFAPALTDQELNDLQNTFYFQP